MLIGDSTLHSLPHQSATKVGHLLPRLICHHHVVGETYAIYGLHTRLIWQELLLLCLEPFAHQLNCVGVQVFELAIAEVHNLTEDERGLQFLICFLGFL